MRQPSKTVLFLCCLLCSLRSLASDEHYFNELRGSQVAPSQVLTVTDDKFRSFTPAQWSGLQNISVRNVVTFELNYDTSVYFYRRPFSCTLNATIHFYANQSDTSEETSTPQTVNLTVRLDTVTGKPYTAIAVYRFSGAYKFSVVINSISSPELGSQLPAIFRLAGRTVVERKYPFTDASTDVSTFQSLNANQEQLFWTPANYPGAESFDLEWTVIDSASLQGYSIASKFGGGGAINIPPDTLDLWFRHNSTRINTTASGYVLNLPYDAGYLLYRIRGVQYHYPDSIRYEGNWNYQAEPSGSTSVQTAAFPVSWHERGLNWQYTASYAEEGKRKEYVRYLDGTQRKRQTVFLDNTDNVSVVAEDIPDDQGRQGVEVLPAPAPDTTLHFFRDFNVDAAGHAYAYTDFATGPGCQLAPLAMGTGTGAARYFSPNSPFPQAIHAAYVPNAHGYPFSVLQYAPDNTGRVIVRGDVDSAFQPGHHPSRYFYGKPMQVELDRLFGSEAGLATHFQKNMVVDPNGQVTVNYLDAAGKTVATALAGLSPLNVDSLPSTIGAMTPFNEQLLAPGNFAADASSHSLTATSTFLAPMSGNYGFRYNIDPVSLVMLYGLNNQNSLCSACYYDLNIHVRDDCSHVLYTVTRPAGQVFDTTCGGQGPVNDTFTVAIPAIGQYYVDYSLQISRNALNYFDSVNLAKNTNIFKFDVFLTQELQRQDFTPCFSDCSTCLARLGTATSFLSRFQVLYRQDSIPFSAADSNYLLGVYQNLLQQCASNIASGACGESACQQKLDVIEEDVTPGGQYALYDSAYNLVQPSINVLQYYASVSNYVDANGNPAQVTLENIDGQDSVTLAPQQLSLADFIRSFQPSWAASLAPFHPEYCLYQWCVANSSSYTFDDMLQQLPDGQTAQSLGYYSLTDFAALLEKDPFFSANPGLYPMMYDSLRLFSRSLLGLSQPDENIGQVIQSALYCTNQTAGFTACSVSPSCRSADLEWTLYLPWYLNLKQEFYAQARAANPQFAGCPNCHIGQDAGSLVTFPLNPVNYAPAPGPTCNTCATGVYRQTGRQGVSFYIEYGTPASPPTDLPAGYGNATFYASFSTPGGNPANAAMGCTFANVWVAEYDSACCGQPGGLCLCSIGSRPSSSCAPVTPTDSLYATKRRVFNGYVNPTTVLTGIQGSSPQQSSDSTAAQITAQGASWCDANADAWIAALGACSATTGQFTQLRAAMVSICTAGYDAKHPYGSSSLPPGASGPYQTFEQAIAGILGSGAINSGCTSELLSMPYPYGNQPVMADPSIQQSTAGTCAQVAAFQAAYAASGFNGTFNQYLLSVLGSDDQMGDAGVADLLNSCSNCNGVLQTSLTLPAALTPGSAPAVSCTSLQTLVSQFQSTYPGLATTDPNYEILYTDFLNHRTGFALGIDDYLAFLGSCSGNALLYNKPLTTPVAPNDNSCVQDLFAAAETNAQIRYTTYIDSVREAFRESYYTRCMALQPSLNVGANLYEYHYTLYYYDQAGNLVKTVPPAGVVLLNAAQTDSVAQDRAYNRTNCYQYSDELQFNNDGYMSFADQPWWDIQTTPFTLEAYVRFQGGGTQGLLSHYQPTTAFGGYGYQLLLRNDSLVFRMASGDNDYYEVATAPIEQLTPLNQWSHLVIERVPTGDTTAQVRIYLNGNIITPLNRFSQFFYQTSGIAPTVATPFLVGSDGHEGFTGRIKQVRIYNRDLPASEVLQNYVNVCLEPSSQNALVSWMPMAEGAGPIAENLHQVASTWTTANTIDWINRSLAVYPAHRLATSYQFNSLDLSVKVHSPDADTSWSWYDRLGRLTAHQTMEQYQPVNGGPTNRFSYTVYDGLGRSVETGEKSNATDVRGIDMLDTNALKTWIASGTDSQVTRLVYDVPALQWVYHPAITGAQQNLRKRIASALYYEAASQGYYDEASHYSYDPEGNVQTFWQELQPMAGLSDSGIKRVDYDYDLVSGKINQVTYQAGKGDQYIHRFTFDADNRLTAVSTSRDSMLWSTDAAYYYYLHGPLARLELGQHKVQGIDYAYTMQEVLKAINGHHLLSTQDTAADINADGWKGTPFAGVSRDVAAVGLGFYPGDYDPVGGTSATALSVGYSATAPGYGVMGNGLYNGNISYATVALSHFDSSTMAGYTYRYDQLNRLLQLRKHGNLPGSQATWDNTSIGADYQESIAYDPNGNIQTYLRNGATASGGQSMDQLTYRYLPGNNQLDHIQDAIPASNYTTDLDNQDTLNYGYDQSGFLIRDAQGGLNDVRWTVNGKIRNVYTAAGATIAYGYNPAAERIYRHVTTDTSNYTDYYIRDPKGEVLAIYTNDQKNGVFHWSEQQIFGLDRVGVWKPGAPVPPAVSWQNARDSLATGQKAYEVTGHLSDVLATVSDKKIGVPLNDTVVDHYVAELLTQNDYYAYGMRMPGRTFAAATGYRYGFNGKENDDEVKGPGNQLDYDARIYDPRVARFLSIDPKTGDFAALTPYQFSSNSPVSNTDLDGEEAKYFVRSLQVVTLKNSRNPSGPALFSSAAAGHAYQLAGRPNDPHIPKAKDGRVVIFQRHEIVEHYDQATKKLVIDKDVTTTVRVVHISEPKPDPRQVSKFSINLVVWGSGTDMDNPLADKPNPNAKIYSFDYHQFSDMMEPILIGNDAKSPTEMEPPDALEMVEATSDYFMDKYIDKLGEDWKKKEVQECDACHQRKRDGKILNDVQAALVDPKDIDTIPYSEFHKPEEPPKPQIPPPAAAKPSTLENKKD